MAVARCCVAGAGAPASTAPPITNAARPADAAAKPARRPVSRDASVTTASASNAAIAHGASSASGARSCSSVKVGSTYDSGDPPCAASAMLASPCGALNSMNRCGEVTPAAATARLIANSSVAVARTAVDRRSWNATAIIGATSGRIGTRKRAGALDPPHHMYIRVELATNAPTVTSSAIANSRRSDRRSIIQHPPIAIR